MTTSMVAGVELTASRALLASLVDYAGLFPPAACSMEEAARRYASYRQSPQAWMLGSFVVPAARLLELEGVLLSIDAVPEQAWSLSVLVSERFDQDLEAVAAARERLGEAATVAALEVAALPASTIGALAERLPGDIPSFFEVPLSSGLSHGLEERLVGIAAAGSFAKVRTGGLVEDVIPSAQELARFLRACRDLGVPFKATAGLHHAVRGSYPLTYEPASQRATMHGFLNLLVASLLVAGEEASANRERDLMAILEEEDARVFRFSRRGLSWRDREWSLREMDQVRRGFFFSFGSCSFTEPVDELSGLGVLDAEGAASVGF
ncbi:MAG TPA: hypothetical protein VNB06_16840 [Thermoanaerobaculia bacterium]|nr:hypothetical protein [Thermoanaerobaculia bacterium]